MDKDTIINAEFEESKSCDDVPRGTSKNVEAIKGKKKRLSAQMKQAKVCDMAFNKGLSAADITRLTDIAPSTVKDIIATFKPIFKELENVAAYRESKGDILAAGQLAALKSAFTDSKLKKASFYSLIQGFSELNKAERLHNGQSTENNMVAVFGQLGVRHVIKQES